MPDSGPRLAEDETTALTTRGYVLCDRLFAGAEEAFTRARLLIEDRDRDEGPLSIIGDFVLPPSDGPPTRDFQTLHFDFGVPLDPEVNHDVACYTALYISADARNVSAATRLVPLQALLSQRAWPRQGELLERLVAYGDTHGGRDEVPGYVEGSLARIVEAAAGTPPELPSVKTDDQFLCGLEFATLSAERSFFARHGLCVEEVAIDVPLGPGELLVFANLALAHGRRGTRAPGELHQRVFGRRDVAPDGQRELRERVLGAFSAAADSRPGFGPVGGQEMPRRIVHTGIQHEVRDEHQSGDRSPQSRRDCDAPREPFE